MANIEISTAKLEVLKLYYERGNAELTERLRLRDTSIYLYMTVVTTLGGFVLTRAVSANQDVGVLHEKELLLLLPCISVSTALIIRNHHMVIGAIRRYTSQIGEILSQETEAPESFDNSEMMKQLDKRYFFRTWASGIPLLLGAALGPLSNTHLLYREPSGAWDLRWWISTAGVGVTLWTILNCHKRRKEMEGFTLKKR